jgi:hypothetical protein
MPVSDRDHVAYSSPTFFKIRRVPDRTHSDGVTEKRGRRIFILLDFLSDQSDESSCAGSLREPTSPAKTIHLETIMKIIYTIGDDNSINAFAAISRFTSER